MPPRRTPVDSVPGYRARHDIDRSSVEVVPGA
jgi:hypothetical protein